MIDIDQLQEDLIFMFDGITRQFTKQITPEDIINVGKNFLEKIYPDVEWVCKV